MKINKKRIIRIIFIVIITLLQLFVLSNNTLVALANSSGDIINPDDYMPGGLDEANNANKLRDMANIIIGTLQIVGTILSVAVLGVLGIKYMMGSVEERAEYKKTLIPYLIGAVMIFGITNILAIVFKIVYELQKLQL